MKKSNIQALLLLQTLIIAVVAASLADNGMIGYSVILTLCLVINIVIVSITGRTTYD